MGLDMYLTKKVTDYETQIYWRKANQIHNWFSKHSPNGNLENCQDFVVTKELLEELKDTCQKVLDRPELAKKLLPTTISFFYGGREYDDNYFEQVRYTIDEINKILEITDFDNEELYYHAWW